MPAIFLNGTSSSGKTSIARAIQRTASIPFLHLSVDAFIEMFNWENAESHPLRPESGLAAVSLFHRALPVMLSSRFPAIIDHVLQEASWHRECRDELKGHRVLYVGVHCPLNVLRERERLRGDRAVGLAEWQARRVHCHGPYDLEVDTARSSPEECARQILAAFGATA